MKKVIPIVLGALLVFSLWMQYQASEQQKILVDELEELKKINAKLKDDLVDLKQNLSDGTSSVNTGGESTDPSINELIEGAGAVFQNSLESVIENVESEFGRVKEQLHQELQRLKEQNTNEKSNDNIDEFGSEDASQEKGSHEKHSN